MEIKKAVFVKSASKLEECPSVDVPEIAMIGRSNVGKSSLVNMLTKSSKLAKVSVTPGKTKLLTFFLINDNWSLVDLPGYGYAKGSKTHRMDWLKVSHDYFLGRQQLKKVFVLIDSSIPPQAIDMDFIHSLYNKNIAFDIIATKIDKANQKTYNQHMNLLKDTLKRVIGELPKILPISNVTKRGRDQLLAYIEEVLFDGESDNQELSTI